MNIQLHNAFDGFTMPGVVQKGDEWGIFNDEGCIERSLWGIEAIRDALTDHTRPDEGGDTPEGVYPARLCPDHEEQPADTCHECHAEEGDDDGEDDLA